MLDVHPPHHAANSWRDFFIHIATITVGLLIAIGLEQTVEALHHRHERTELEARLHEEAEHNLDLTQGNIKRLTTVRVWVESSIAALNAAPVVNGQITRKALPSMSGLQGSIWNPSQTVWAVAKASGTVALLPQDEAQVYARVDFEGEQLKLEAPAMHRAMGDFVALLQSRLGLPQARQPYFLVAERVELIRSLSELDAEVNGLLGLEETESGACRAVVHGARSVDEVIRYIDSEGHLKPIN